MDINFITDLPISFNSLNQSNFITHFILSNPLRLSKQATTNIVFDTLDAGNPYKTINNKNTQKNCHIVLKTSTEPAKIEKKA